jgi:maltooligosyltrehalose trehalohydrolase
MPVHASCTGLAPSFFILYIDHPRATTHDVKRHHILPFGAEIYPSGTRFKLWAPEARSVAAVIEAPPAHTASSRVELRTSPLQQRSDGWFEGTVAGITAGSLYRFRIDDEVDVPDPAARFNPQGITGPSEVIDPSAFVWNDDSWHGRPWHEAVLYELHVGTFTPQGTFAAIIPRLAELAKLGVTCLEVLPVATFPGSRGWGYDGVLPFAPHPAYGRPEEFKQLIAAAHDHGISVVLDVVYNHFGPQGNYLHRYARQFFTDRHRTPWGDAINFEGASGQPVRQFFIQNALYWLDEYHLDGLRLDAIHAIKDDSPVHFVDELAQTLSVGPARHRHIHLILENHLNQARRLRPSDDPAGANLSRAQWNDDFHHALHVIATDETDGYYADYTDAIALTGRILAEGFAYQGEPSKFAGNEPRGEISRELPPTAFINFLQNHDQIGNRAFGERIAQLAPAERLRAAMAVLLLAPSPPLLFMGEEYAAPQPFLYFCEYDGELAAAITNGRRGEFAQFRAFADEQARAEIPDPNAAATFARSQLQWEQRETGIHGEWLQFTRNLLALRRDRIVPLIPFVVAGGGTYAVQDRLLQVQWPLRDGRQLSLRANFSASPRATSPAGDLIYALRKEDAATTGAWDVQLWLSRS